MGCRAGAASSDAVDMRSQPIMPPCFTSCFRDPRNRPLLLAIRESHENSNAEAVKMLIANGASTGGVYENENLYNDVPSPLILAIRKGQRDFVAMLLEHAASVDERECGWRLEYPLHAAVYSQDFEILKALLKKGPKVDCLDFL
jgi:ankyrin repeat protein